MDIKALIEQVRAAMATKLQARTAQKAILDSIRAAAAADGNRDLTTDEATRSEAAAAEVRKIDAELETQRARVAELEDELRRDEAADALAREVHPAAGGTTATGTDQRATDTTVRVGQEPRTFRADNDPKGIRFLQEVAATAITGRWSDDLARHMAEERVERGAQIEAVTSRAAGTGAFAGLVVPQYLVDLVAPHAKGGRPFADACRHHDLPESGMTVNISRITTATSAALQASENTAVSETNIDDTLLTINLQTNAGQQTLSRQAIERGTGVEAVVMDDLFRRYHTTLDSTLLNQATTGLAASSSVIAYTSGTPKVVELYPIIVQGLAAVEAAMLDQASGENIVVMHSRRWYWLQNGLSATWPLISQPGVVAQMLGENYNVAYGKGVRGMLPNGTPVIVDNNVTTAGLAGAVTGGTQDHVYVIDKREAHLWEDPSAPVFIRAEQPAAASLGVLLVLYGYFAYTFQRYAESQVISGTGTVTPAFTGV